jgi:HEAT repeat protein
MMLGYGMSSERSQASPSRNFKVHWVLSLCLLPFLVVGATLTTPIGRVWMHVSLMHLTSEDSRIESVQTLGEMGPVAAPGIRVALHDSSLNIRFAALLAVEHWGLEAFRVAPELVQLLDDQRRIAGKSEMGSLSSQSQLVLQRLQSSAIPALLKGLKNSSSRVRRIAAAILGNLGPKADRCVPSLLRCLKDDDKGVRQSAAKALCRIAKLDQTTAISDIEKKLH